MMLLLAAVPSDAQEFECRGFALGYAKFKCRLVKERPVLSDYCKLTAPHYQRLRQPIPREALALLPRATKLGIRGVQLEYEAQCRPQARVERKR
jgi:hypothetical protein